MIDWGTVLIAAISATGAFLAAWMGFRAKAKDDKQLLIDQLQEERKEARDETAKERALAKEEGEAYRKQIDRHWQDKALSRQHVAALRNQVWTGGKPPPVDPPPGYIE